MILEIRKGNYASFHFFTFFFFCHEVLGRDAMIVIVLNADSVDMNPSYSHIAFKKMIEY